MTAVQLENGVWQEPTCPECGVDAIDTWPFPHCWKCGYLTPQPADTSVSETEW